MSEEVEEARAILNVHPDKHPDFREEALRGGPSTVYR